MSANPYCQVLAVAPDSDTLKGAQDEIDALYELGYHVRTLTGRVSDNRLFDAVRKTRFGTLIFMAHGSKDGTQLTDGALAYQGIQQIARQCGAKLVYLNECFTAPIASRLSCSGVPVAIGAFDAIEDDVAKQTSMSFFQALAETHDPHQAFTFACDPGRYNFAVNGNYITPIGYQIRTLTWAVAVEAVGIFGTLAALLFHVWR